MPRITFGFIIVAVILYVVGARYPGLARKIGAA